ncbi:MAG: 16S rRNA (cytosine(1402)-N(4))-methyltransferase RsmH [Alphaproteobacteria bacterium]|nr:16S rRNA (cytosine(1402)-N(4))-methyltransferase RsmH [Alphaproteobacteria bacterium]
MRALAHIPVLGREAVHYLGPRPGGIYVDATFGGGGYSRAILEVPGTRVIGIDRDPSAITGGAELMARLPERLTLVEGRFSDLKQICESVGVTGVDGVVMDIGLSSMQIDQAERGFSFRFDGPLDMRMGTSGPSAADVIKAITAEDLATVLYLFGEERHSRKLARAIVTAREQAPIVTTRALADIVARVIHGRPGELHPATRAFQALRILVNEELEELAQGLCGAEQILKSGGRLVVVSFHSLEDRIVKNFLSRGGGTSRHLPERVVAEPCFEVLTRRPVVAGEEEVAHNPRARSAKLRAAQRSGAEARPDIAHAPWPRLFDLIRRG